MPAYAARRRILPYMLPAPMMRAIRASHDVCATAMARYGARRRALFFHVIRYAVYLLRCRHADADYAPRLIRLYAPPALARRLLLPIVDDFFAFIFADTLFDI